MAHCATVSAAIGVLQRTPIDVVLLDYDLGEERGTDLLRQLHACKSSARVLMVTAGMSERTILDILNAGVAGVLFKHSNPTQLVDAIRKIAQGEVVSGMDNSLKTMPLLFNIALNPLPPGDYDCQVTVLDPTGQKITFRQAPITLVP
ncbi:response regulator [Edaphobacter paludis]|uniref:Response regulator n=1 Tax=Edaphobacter paludis TaxID=3035702 RepID=A0AAU7D351_9BACT